MTKEINMLKSRITVLEESVAELLADVAFLKLKLLKKEKPTDPWTVAA